MVLIFNLLNIDNQTYSINSWTLCTPFGLKQQFAASHEDCMPSPHEVLLLLHILLLQLLFLLPLHLMPHEDHDPRPLEGLLPVNPASLEAPPGTQAKACHNLVYKY